MKQLSSVGLFYGLMILGMLRAVTGTQTCSAVHEQCQAQTAGQGLLQGASHPCEQVMAWLGELHQSQKTNKSEKKHF